MWIMLTKKLPTVVSPPKLSIHWSTPWPDLEHFKGQISLIDLGDDDELDKLLLEVKPLIRNKTARRKLDVSDPELLILAEKVKKHTSFFSSLGFFEHNWAGARKILYKNESIRIFPDEFSEVTDESMKIYTIDDGLGNISHKLIPGNVAEATMLEHILETDQHFVKEAAILDGCTEQQAILVALGLDILDGFADNKPLGWYKCKKKYAQVYCHDYELVG